MGKWRSTDLQRMLESCPYENWRIDVNDVREEWLDLSIQDAFSTELDGSTRDLHEIFGNLLTDEEYQKAMIKEIMSFNEANPSTNFTPVDFPWPDLWIKKSLARVLDIVCRYHAANIFNSVSGGTQVPIHERVQALSAERDRLRQETERKQLEIKTSINYDSVYGDIYPAGGYGGFYYG